jgi:hypothetical protein
LAALTLVLAGTLSPSAHAESQSGELSVGVRDESGNPESMKFRFAFGEYESAKSLHDETQTLRAVIESLPNEPSEIPHIIDVFTEDSPQGRVKGERMVARLRKIAKKLESDYGEKAQRIAVEAVAIPAEIASAKKAAESSPGIFAALKDAMSKPSPFDVRTGIVIGTYGSISSFSAWFSTPGIDPLMATGLATYQSAFSAFQATFSKSISKAFSVKLKKSATHTRKSTIYARRMAYGLIVAELTRLIAGTQPGGDSITSLAGQAQIITLTLGFSVLDTLVITARDKAFMDKPSRFAYGYLASYFLLSPWSMMETAGSFPVLFDLTVYKVRLSTFALIGTYIGIHQAFTHAPEKAGIFLDKVIGPIDGIVARVQRSIGKTCKSLFTRGDDFGDSLGAR